MAQRLLMQHTQADTGDLTARTQLTKAQTAAATYGLQSQMAIRNLFLGGSAGAPGAGLGEPAPPSTANTGGPLSGSYQEALANAAEASGNWNLQNSKGYAGMPTSSVLPG